MFNKILIANRGEIAVRVIRACREMGIISAAVYSDADKNSLHIRQADEAYYIGGSLPSKSYLDKEKIIKLALEISAEAIHPGYGFLSENAEFIKLCESSGICFIGPSSGSVEMMGSKTSARKIMFDAGVPIVPGTKTAVLTIEEGLKIAEETGYPVLIKASAGGGGKGMRKAENSEEFAPFFEAAKREALKAFGNDEVYIEKYIVNPKHIEVQIIGDKAGNYVHLFERECSIQRRHQKIIEEAPSAFIDEETRLQITTAAVNSAKACNYYNAGTIEFLMDRNKNFYFLEMNTRLQVEHPVTEMITGIDIVREQINIAFGNNLSFTQADVQKRGHAIECRVYAENTDNNFLPSTGKINKHRLPSGFGIRVDSGVYKGSDVTMFYDPLLSKLIAWGENRSVALSRINRALTEYHLAGILNNISLLKWIIENEKFAKGEYDINFIEENLIPLIPGKWRETTDEEYLEVAAIISVLLRNERTSDGVTKKQDYNHNGWNAANYE